jgi:hypothetical protein
MTAILHAILHAILQPIQPVLEFVRAVLAILEMFTH